jgi:hypothetical protein
MEAGINPDSQPADPFKLFSILLDLSTLCTTLSQLSHTTYKKSEQVLIHQLFRVALSNARNTYNNVLLFHKHRNPMTFPNGDEEKYTDLYVNLKERYTLLWDELKIAHRDNQVRVLLFQYLSIHILLVQHLAENILLVDTCSRNDKYFSPTKPNYPSAYTQIVTEPKQILDPYLASLSENYYFPLSTMSQMENMENVSDTQEGSPRTTTTTPSPTKHKPVITADNSIEELSKMLNEMESDDPPVESQQETTPVFQQETQTKPTYFKHRFAIYKKNIPTYRTTSTLTQLQFKSFSKCLKSIDAQIQFLPIRNNRRLNSLSTTDQLNSVDENSLQNFFKAYKRTKKTLSGDFHIGSKLTFEDLISHKDLESWFIMHGYNIILNGCQTSDMVRIRFLTRVRGFTYRDDLKSYITESDQWNKSPFHFRLYFDSFSTNSKGKMTYVMMIDIDRPNIEQGMKFFQDFFNGDLKNSPNGLQYMFLPLYKKTYSEDERLQIIKDNDHHTEGVSVVALSGLNHLDTIVQLQQGSATTIRNLHLAVPALRTSNRKLFLQVERQAGNSWLLCCFYTTDSTEVTLRLGSLESLLKKYVKTDDLPKLFQTEVFTLKFNGQAAPLKKGKSKYIFQEVPAETASYANRAMGKLITAS